MLDESLKIDVGEADEQETEIDLDAEPEQSTKRRDSCSRSQRRR